MDANHHLDEPSHEKTNLEDGAAKAMGAPDRATILSALRGPAPQDQSIWKEYVPLPDPTPVGIPLKPTRVHKFHKPKLIGIMQGATQDDILDDLGKVKADISIKQLLGIAPQCRSTLQSTLVRKRTKPMVNEVSLSPDPGVLVIHVRVDGILISGV